MNKKVNRDVWVSIVTFALGTFTIIFALNLPTAKSFVQSAGFLPFCLSIALLLLSVILFLMSLKTGINKGNTIEDNAGKTPRINFKEFFHSNKFMVIFNMLLVAFLVFVCIPYMGFFISGTIFMLYILFTRVKAIKWYWSIIITAVSMTAIWAIFVKLFGLAIK